MLNFDYMFYKKLDNKLVLVLNCIDIGHYRSHLMPILDIELCLSLDFHIRYWILNNLNHKNLMDKNKKSLLGMMVD
jgi:hypothetical protein